MCAHTDTGNKVLQETKTELTGQQELFKESKASLNTLKRQSSGDRWVDTYAKGGLQRREFVCQGEHGQPQHVQEQRGKVGPSSRYIHDVMQHRRGV
jgi:hypothetical protein